MTEAYYVEIVHDESGHVTRRIGPMSEREAEKVEHGAFINLNHMEYSTRIVKHEQHKL